MTQYALYRLHRLDQLEAELRDRWTIALAVRIARMRQIHLELLRLEAEAEADLDPL